MLRIPDGARVFDVTVPISPDLPVWPGDPEVVVEPVTRIARGDAANVSRVTMSSHAGTHVDAPWHFVDDGARLAEIPLARWLGPCVVVHVADDVRRIEPANLEAAAISTETERLILRTANSARWRLGKLGFEEDYVALSAAGASWLVERGIGLVGIDYLSIDPYGDETDQAHRVLLGNGVLIVENLNLSAVAPGAYTLLCLPLKLAAGDGAPARVLLIGEA